MLASWYASWQRKHDAVLARVRVKVTIYVRGTAYLLTPERALAAAGHTFEELYRDLDRHPHWGLGRDGQPDEQAMRGLIARRLQSRVQDQLRGSREEETRVQALD